MSLASPRPRVRHHYGRRIRQDRSHLWFLKYYGDRPVSYTHLTLPTTNEPVGNKRPPGLTEATPLAPICELSRRDELRRGDLKEQTPRAARAVLTTPFDVDPHQMLHASYGGCVALPV